MQVGAKPHYPMVRSYAAPSAPAPSAPSPANPAPTASAQAAEAGQAFAQQFGAFTLKAQSFLTNLWDTVLGPAVKGLLDLIKGAFGG